MILQRSVRAPLTREQVAAVFDENAALRDLTTTEQGRSRAATNR